MTDFIFRLPADDVQVAAGPSGDPTTPVQLTIGRHRLVLPVDLAEQAVDALIAYLAEIS